MSSYTRAELTIDGSLATVTISTGEGLNVMSSKTTTQFGEVVDQLANKPEIRFVVFRGAGKVFIAGADIKEMCTFDAAAARNFGQIGKALCDAIEALPMVTVAALNGAALGGGCEVALACDFRIATSQVKIGLPETTLGLLPAWGGIPRAIKLVGISTAKRLIFGGTPVSAKQAKELGLIDEVVSDDEALDKALENLRASLTSGGPVAVGLAKRAMRDGQDIAAFAACFNDSESQEGLKAFAEKRKASWAEG